MALTARMAIPPLWSRLRFLRAVDRCRRRVMSSFESAVPPQDVDVTEPGGRSTRPPGLHRQTVTRAGAISCAGLPPYRVPSGTLAPFIRKESASSTESSSITTS